MANGVLTFEELMELWRSVVDQGYSDPLLSKPESGIEFIEQAARQFAKVSRNLNAAQQQMFILPWSGQTGEPAGGERHAIVTLEMRRTQLLEQPFVFQAGQFLVEQLLVQPTLTGGEVVSMFRAYAVATTAVLMPGDPGPLDVQFVAVMPGAGYNEPPPNTITGVLQAGQHLGNSGASVVPGVNSHLLIAREQADVPAPQNIGSYVRFEAGANAGRVVRVIGYNNPTPGVDGGALLLAADTVVELSNIIGTFVLGEEVQQNVSGAVGVLIALQNDRALLERRSGAFVTGQSIAGTESLATADVEQIDVDAGLVAETNTATWQVLGHVEHFGIQATNPDSPTLGRSPFLDTLGAERGVLRAAAESDESYRPRVATPADVVSPNAIRRTANRVLAPLGLEVCFREVGSDLLPGVFYDEGPAAYPNAFDLELVDLTWASGQGFRRYERVRQVNADGVSEGEIVMSYATPSVALGVVRVTGPTFTTAAPVVGLSSGYSETPTSVAGGLAPTHRFVVQLDLVEFRAFFMLGMPRLELPQQLGGLFFDDSYRNAFDAVGIENFFDAPIVDTLQPVSPYYAAVWNAVQEAKMGGVRWQMYVEDLGCF